MKTCIYSFLLILAACGGGGGGNSPQSGAGSPPFVGEFTVHVTGSSETEPNNSFAEADAHTMPTHGADADYVGFAVIGAVNDTTDPADYFVFTASRAHVFTIQMCPSIIESNSPCSSFNESENIDTSVAYFEILD